VDEVGPPRVVKPEEAPAEVALRLAGRYLTRLITVVELRIVDRGVLFAFDLQGVRGGSEVYGVAAAPAVLRQMEQ
jgi:hypothetical protein